MNVVKFYRLASEVICQPDHGVHLVSDAVVQGANNLVAQSHLDQVPDPIDDFFETTWNQTQGFVCGYICPIQTHRKKFKIWRIFLEASQAGIDQVFLVSI